MEKQILHLSALSLIFICFVKTNDITYAQITADNTLGTKVESPDKLNFTITDGKQVGSNLFHSFQEFSVPEKGTASFENNSNIKNIISRVTGNLSSHINGSLQTTGSANLFLINPNGIIFGVNASLNINGSFIASTASKMLFADGTEFSATDTQKPPLLTEKVPVGLQFGQTAKPIQINESTLSVSPRETLAFLGGDIFINASEIEAPAGRIELGSVTNNSLVTLTPLTQGWALGYASSQNFQDIEIKNSYIFTEGEGSGAIQFYGRNIVIKNVSQVGGTTNGNNSGQPLIIKGSESVEVNGDSRLFTLTNSSKVGGNIIIETKRLLVYEGGMIEASTEGVGQGGSLTVDADEFVEIVGGGNLYSSLRVRSFSTQKDAGDAGEMHIDTKKVILRDGGQMTTSTLSAGDGGRLSVNADESIEAIGFTVKDNLDFPSGLISQSRGQDGVSVTGRGGDIIIKTQRLVVKDGARMSVAAIAGSLGEAGTLYIDAPDSVVVSGTGIDKKGQIAPSSLFAASEGSGSAGDLTIITGRLTVQDGAEISVSNQGFGRAGNLTVDAGSINLNNRGKITADTTGGGGYIFVKTPLLILRNQSAITTNATGNNVTGGDISINARNGFIIAVPGENSDISANSEDFRGGNVEIDALNVFGIEYRNEPTSESDITATGRDSAFNGLVQINTPDVDVRNGLVEQPINVLDASQKISTACTPGSRQSQSSFIATGRGGLPPNPYEPLDSNEVWRDVQLPRQLAENSVSTTPERIVEAQGWIINKQGNVELIAYPSPVDCGWR
ncbi:filamentous hemagglutinin N-terminal domain-containing protein [Anabaena azotica]|uniref:S-layer family protein n=1 Tax=Anabaena azotica FACHB-119 TaxID=947527 RepID=A0ABR8CYH0_9NOST|nr:S-layer family protein [Anabaena azotica]MBD2499990.1 S-layer family protein [Anabaena azotica FACHB-119]